jgi:alpha-glucoside transport system permease protein
MSTQPLPTPVAAPPPSEGRDLTPRSVFERFQGMLFVLPALVALGLFLVYPAYYTIRLAFYEGSFNFGFAHYLGLKNFKDLLTHDPDFLDTSKFHGFNIVKELLYKSDGGALVNNIHWVIFYIGFALVIGLGLAVLAVRVRYERAVKTAIFVPMAISATAVGIIWLFVYSPNPDTGVLNATIHAFDNGFHPIAWLGRPNLVNYCLIFAYIWASVGFVMVVLSAAIKGIPAEVMEAARVDGAGEWNIFRRIMIPMLSLPISVVTIWLFVNVIKVFDIIYVMTGGGPGTTSRVIAFTMYEETFLNGRPGYGAAVAVIMLVIIAPVMVLNVRRFRSDRVVA